MLVVFNLNVFFRIPLKIITLKHEHYIIINDKYELINRTKIIVIMFRIVHKKNSNMYNV